MLQFLPALLLLLVNGHLVGHGDLALLAQTERVIWALSRPEGKPLPSERETDEVSVRLIIRALAWVSRWQAPAPASLDSAPEVEVIRQWAPHPIRLPLAHRAADRSRDGPCFA